MLRRQWQTLMISLARSERWKRFMQTRRPATAMAAQYVGGRNPDQGVQRALSLQLQGIRSSLFYLGEYVDSREKLAENIGAKQALIPLLTQNGIDLHISADPTQLGCSLDWQQGCENITRLAQALSAASENAGDPTDGVHCLMLDMEDFSVNQATIDLHNQLQEQGLKVGLTLQAYLHKTPEDIDQQIARGARVRLVKGAFAAGPEQALQSQADIRRRYQQLIGQMLSPDALSSGFYPIFATHDHRLHRYAIDQAHQNGWPDDRYEFEMLYGARDDLARQLADQKLRIRLYLPFGKDWWPYAVRRIGENPRNALLLARSLLNR